MAATYTLGTHSFSSRLIVGSGKYASLEETRRCTEASGAEMITVALRRVDLNAPKGMDGPSSRITTRNIQQDFDDSLARTRRSCWR